MITIWLAGLLMLASGFVGALAMALCSVAGRADECARCTGRTDD